MLPFLKSKRDEGGIAGTIMKNRTPDEKSEENQEDSKLSLAKDILNAIQMDSPDALVDAMEAMFKHLDKEPHEEGPHTKASPHTYDAQKEE